MNIIIFILDYWKIAIPTLLFFFLLPFFLNKFYPNNSYVRIIKYLLQIFFTNWINLIVILISTFVFLFLSAILTENFSFGQAVFGSAFVVLVYGIMIWIGFFILIGILDFVLFSIMKQIKYINYKLGLEWLLISSPLIYWLIKYNQWIFLVAIFAFLIGQYIRRYYIIKILNNRHFARDLNK